MRSKWLAIAFAALLITPMGAVLAQNGDDETSDDEEEMDANETLLADLEPDELQVNPEEPGPGDSVLFSAEIANDGEADADAFDVTFALDGDQHGDAVRVDGLQADERTEVLSDPWNATGGEHEVTVHVDPADDVNESDEENNNESEEFDVEAGEAPDEDQEEFGDDEDANETEANETDEDERPDDVPARDSEPEWDEDNGTYTGEHIQVTVDEELPGLTNVTYLDPNASVFASAQLPGDNFTFHAVEHVLAGETDAAEFAVRDDDGGHLSLEADDEGNATISVDVADGVEVNETHPLADDDDENETDEDDESVYRLDLAGNETAWFFGENLAFDNGTFTVADEAHLAPTFPPGDDRDEDEREEEREERREEARERMEERREAGSQFESNNSSYQGDNVAFQLSEDGSGLDSYAIVGSIIPVFDDVDLGTNETEWEAHGRTLEIRADDARLKAIDVPPAVLIVEAGEDANATLAVAEGVNVTQADEPGDDDEDADSDEDRVWRLELADNRTGWVMGEEIAYDNGTFAVSDKAIFRATPEDPEASANRGPGSMPDQARDEDERGPSDEDERGERGPDARPAHALDGENQQKVEQALAEGKVSAEVHLGENDTEPVAVEMGDVQVKKAWAQRGDGVRAGMQIEAPDGTPGTTVTLNLDESKLGNLTIDDASQKLGVRYDNETIPMADDLDDVLDPSDDNGTAEYLLLVGSDKVQVLVSVPHFSPHTVEVYETQSGEQVDTNGAPGFGAVALLAATGIALVARATRLDR